MLTTNLFTPTSSAKDSSICTLKLNIEHSDPEISLEDGTNSREHQQRMINKVAEHQLCLSWYFSTFDMFIY